MMEFPSLLKACRHCTNIQNLLHIEGHPEFFAEEDFYYHLCVVFAQFLNK